MKYKAELKVSMKQTKIAACCNTLIACRLSERQPELKKLIEKKPHYFTEQRKIHICKIFD